MTELICMQCKHIGKPGRKKRGSTRTEFIGWLMFPLGLPYTLWRMLSKKPACSQCSGEHFVLLDSIAGQRMLKIIAGENVAPTPETDSERPLPKSPPTEKPPRPPQDPNAW